MAQYAQTIVQLYGQLMGAGYATSDMERIRDGHDLEAQLVSAKYRANGKPEIAHLIGTASILATHGAELPVVLAGLLHNAYSTGDFGSFWPRRMTRRKRRAVRDVIGPEAENLVAQYSLVRWTPEKTASLAQAVPEISDTDRGVILIRLANELEEAADLFSEHEERRARKLKQLGDYVAIARNLSMPRLAEELDEAHRIARSRQIPKEIAAPRTGTFHLPPLSYSRRPKPALSFVLRRIWLCVPEALRSRFRRWFVKRALSLD